MKGHARNGGPVKSDYSLPIVPPRVFRVIVLTSIFAQATILFAID
jgi:hypothetical protein